jgi:hypothetical protein
MPDVTPAQQAIIDASIGSVQRLAMRLIDLPKDQREGGFEIVRRNFEGALKKFGIDGAQGQAWLDSQIEAIRRLVAEIETSGGSLGGKA